MVVYIKKNCLPQLHVWLPLFDATIKDTISPELFTQASERLWRPVAWGTPSVSCYLPSRGFLPILDHWAPNHFTPSSNIPSPVSDIVSRRTSLSPAKF